MADRHSDDCLAARGKLAIWTVNTAAEADMVNDVMLQANDIQDATSLTMQAAIRRQILDRTSQVRGAHMSLTSTFATLNSCQHLQRYFPSWD